MEKVLITDNDQAMCTAFAASLKKYEKYFVTLFAADGEEAMNILDQENISLLVTDLIMPEVDGFALLAHMKTNHPAIPCIVMTAYTLPGLQNNLSKRVLHFLKKPVEPDTLAELIIGGLKRVDKGATFSGISVPGLMQLIEAEDKTCLLSIHSKGKKQGMMYFHKGELYDAIYGKLNGKEAALILIAMDDVQIHDQAPPRGQISKRIHLGTQSLVLEAMRLKDEAEAESPDHQLATLERKEELLKEGIRLCEGLNLKRAQRPLLELVRKNPENIQGWLWLSRTLSRLDQLQIALKRGYKLAPQHAGIKQDIRKLRSAGKVGLNEIQRCPFCFAPIIPNTEKCHFCKSYIVVNAEILPQIGNGAYSKELHLTIKRFERVLARELNIKVLYFTGLACLNLNNFDGTLQYLEQLQHYVGDEEHVYTSEVEQIVAFIASRQTVKEAEIAPIREVETPVPSGATRKKNVLIVEDSPTTRKVIKMTLQGKGFHVLEAVDGVEALSKINDGRPDLILLDVMLPKLDGYGILSVLKQNKDLGGIPVIMLTSKDSLKDKLKGRFSSASAYLTKPFKPAKLIKIVNKYIQ